MARRLAHLCGILPAGAILALLAVQAWVDPAKSETSRNPDVVFALIPSGVHSEPETRIYPPGTGLYRLRRSGSSAGPSRLAVELDLVSPPVISHDGLRVLFSGRRKEGDSAQIWELDLDSESLRPLTGVGVECTHPLYLPDGGIVFSREVAGGVESESRACSLFRAGGDGSDAERITFGPGRERAAAILPDGRIFYYRQVEEAPAGVPRVRGLVVNPDGTGVDRYLPGGESASPSEAPAISASGIGGTEEFGLFLRDSSAGHERLLFRREGFRPADPVQLTPRASPPIVTSVVDRSRQVGWLLCLNAYRSAFQEEWEAGGLETVQVLDARMNTVLGEAPIETDGSFFLEVPSDRLLVLQCVDREGSVISRLETGIWVRPNEHRGCVGCHEPRYLAPQNRRPLALMKPPVVVGPWANDGPEAEPDRTGKE